ncbi:uncharacterized protein LOC114323069 [Camellia sinensis]|uniref:uncharacterized protein LOC114323069 n=1 Tax=Camellia sinensis TaxID=4442 RepID=UPI00103685FD|nr:uncharacterized protein LOC114323069 [Camellia sinensis]
MVSSCGGLSLFGSCPERFLFVGNHVTQKYKNLPFPIAKGHLLLSCHIGYISCTEEYKVVCHCEISGGEYRWFVLSVDKNNMSWRRMETSLKRISFYCDDGASVSVGGDIYCSQMNSHIFAVDLYDEPSHSIQVPNEFVGSCYSLLELGNSLSFIVRHLAEVHVCILKDLRCNEWAKRGLSLFSGSYPERFLFVGNHVTQKYKSLHFPIAKGHLLLSCHIGYISCTEEYKVVCHCEISGGEYRWFVLSVDKNNMSWRRMETSLKRISFYCDDGASVSVGGDIYCSQMNSHIFAVDLYDETSHLGIKHPEIMIQYPYGTKENVSVLKSHIFAVDLYDDTSHSVQVPNEFVGSCYSLLELENSLSFIVRHSAEVHVCILKDLRCNEWAKLYKITEAIDGPNILCESFIPVGCWLAG